MPNLTIVGLEDYRYSDYQCFLFEGIKSAESPDIAEFIKRWVEKEFSVWGNKMNAIEGEDYHVTIRHISAITDASTHDVKDPHLQL